MAVPTAKTTNDLPFHTCKHCQNIEFRLGEEPVLKFTLKDILIAAREACKFCQLMLDGVSYDSSRRRLSDRLSEFKSPEDWFLKLEKNKWAVPPGGVTTVFVFAFYKGRAGFAGSIEMDDEEEIEEESGKLFRFSFTSSDDRLILCAQTGDPAAIEVTTQPIKLSTALPDDSRLWRHWLQKCLTTHKLCKRTAPFFMPKRLIKIWRQSGQVCLRLFDTENVQPLSYAALSYCWGGPQPAQTTLAIVKAYQVSLDWKIIPKTIQDAIITTLELELNYLWVDSLCIIQDSEQDKEQEMAKMPDIYRQAIVTIAASTADKATEGFLQHDRLDNKNQIFRLPYTCMNGNLGCVTMLPTNENDLWNEGPLQYRAWALQERALSSRILSFSRKSTRWLCATSDTFTDGWIKNLEGYNGRLLLLAELPFQQNSTPNPHPQELAQIEVLKTRSHPNTSTIPKFSARSSTGILEPESIYSPLKILDIWLKLVTEYSGRTLSFSSDKFRAISAVGQEFGNILGRPYLAGLWLIDPFVELLWEWDWDWDGPKNGTMLRHLGHGLQFQRLNSKILRASVIL
ncbi:HET-domain-containing protein [Stipitochalara longipes BDJ]|nr:HET-domain-containing protein [Stipitochalara longipes BDJ]